MGPCIASKSPCVSSKGLCSACIGLCTSCKGLCTACNGLCHSYKGLCTSIIGLCTRCKGVCSPCRGLCTWEGASRTPSAAAERDAAPRQRVGDGAIQPCLRAFCGSVHRRLVAGPVRIEVEQLHHRPSPEGCGSLLQQLHHARVGSPR